MDVRDPRCSQCGGSTAEMWQCKGCGKIWCRTCLYRQRRAQGGVTALTEPTQEALDQISQHAHPWCVVCTRVHQAGLGLRFRLQDDGSVEARFVCNGAYQGYGGVLYGGIAAAVLDGAMTNCLFARGVEAYTAKLTLRFRSPIEVGNVPTARARVSRSRRPLYVVQAELVQGGQVKATAAGKFMERPG